MTKIIKFRAFNLESKSYTYPVQIITLNNGELVAERDELVLEQFTGLTDSKGTEIYEGDIVEFEKDFREPVRKIVWKDGGFTYDNTFYDWDGMLYADECKVVGNCHENPELLEP